MRKGFYSSYYSEIEKNAILCVVPYNENISDLAICKHFGFRVGDFIAFDNLDDANNFLKDFNFAKSDKELVYHSYIFHADDDEYNYIKQIIENSYKTKHNDTKSLPLLIKQYISIYKNDQADFLKTIVKLINGDIEITIPAIDLHYTINLIRSIKRLRGFDIANIVSLSFKNTEVYSLKHALLNLYFKVIKDCAESVSVKNYFCDIKPENMMVCENPYNPQDVSVKMIDYAGLALGRKYNFYTDLYNDPESFERFARKFNLMKSTCEKYNDDVMNMNIDAYYFDIDKYASGLDIAFTYRLCEKAL